MPTREDLLNRYSGLRTEELFHIIENRFDYTEVAVSVAWEELSKRNMTEEEVSSYRDFEIRQAEEFIEKNIVDDLSFLQKNFFYFLWFPLITFPFRHHFRQYGYFLKLRQATYYSLCGFLSFLVSAAFSNLMQLKALPSLGVWMVGFMTASAFDEFFNRRKNIKRLERLISRKSEKS